jgi:hypothetical protein
VLESSRRATDPALTSLRRWPQFVARLVLFPALALTLFALALELGVKQKEYVIAGPFQAISNPPRNALFVSIPTDGPARWWRQPMLGDIPEKPFRSFLQLRINGREMGPPHQQHAAIEDGTTSGFSHWGPVVIFSLPAGVRNAPETTVTLSYSIRPRLWVTLASVFFTLLFGWLGYHAQIMPWPAKLHRRATAALIRAERPAAFVAALPGLAALGAGYVALAASVAFI